jgi:hypothetical protein
VADDIIRNPIQAFNGVGRKDNGVKGKAVHVHVASSDAEGGTATITTYSAPNSPITVTAANTTVLAANASRKGAKFVNYGSVGCFLWEGATPAVGKGVYLAPNGGAYEITSANLYKGVVTAITASGTTTLSIAEGV